MRSLFCLAYFIIALVVPTKMKAQDPFDPVQDLTAFKKQFEKATSQIKTIKSKFRQEKNLAMLQEQMISEGDFWFKRSNKIRIEYQRPFQYLLIMSNDEILIQDHGKQNRISTKSNKLFQQINQIILDCVQGSMLDNTDFAIDAFENKNTYRLVMKPLQKGLQGFFSEIVVYVSRDDFSVSKLEMFENGGDSTVINFWGKELNTNVPDSVFDFKQ
ncbi:MAG: outer membrane lipoprotein carrier protein LolA [Cyclobacteriaceae bacterium]